MNRRRFGSFVSASTLLTASFAAWPAFATAAFDHGAWTALLKKYVVLESNGNASLVRYAGFEADRPALQAYLKQLSTVDASTFDGWPKAERLAFLINAYNAFTVELILSRYPDLGSIKDLGGLLSSPWKKDFVPLLGKTLSLDDIEHGMLRKRGAYDDPRIHFAVNCASVGCPMLRSEAYVGDRVDAQLAQQATRFMSDDSRNRYAPDKQRLEVSMIFDWYGDDFRQGFLGIDSTEAFFARYAERLAAAPEARAEIAAQRVPVSFLEYDWRLNDAR